MCENQVTYCLGDQGGGCGEGILVDASNVEWEVPIIYKKKGERERLRERQRERERQVPW
jgi:hypothetical protein